MDAREVDYQRLLEMKNKSDEILRLKSKIENEEGKIENEKKRLNFEIDDFSCECIDAAKLKIASEHAERRGSAYLVTCIPILCYGIIVVYFDIIRANSLGTAWNWLFSIYNLALIWIPLFVGYKTFGRDGRGICGHLLTSGIYFAILFLGFGDDVIPLCISLLMIPFLLLITSIMKMIFRKSDQDKIDLATNKYNKRHEKYLENVESLKEKHRKTEKEVELNVQECSNRIQKYENMRKEALLELKAMPWLSDVDKDNQTLTTLVNYFERRRADSIKEAMNLYVQEARAQSERNLRNWQYREMMEAQKEAEEKRLKLIKENNEKNEKLREKLYDELEEIKKEREKNSH